MELPDRKIFLVGFGWAGLVSLLTWLVPVAAGGAFNTNLIDLGFGVLILGGVGHAAYTGARENPSTVSVAFAVFAAVFATVQLGSVLG
ncbi:hypothetical protein [Halolamina sp.]|jgi:hypothetical protein|uniref:hypothetical protein n=1 Tax=Halolamina sp. TaxID=1940283 RepID=UPI000223B8B2|nr:hypothetical protein Halar_1456 [halophilic archaeon DL31]